MPLYFYVLDGRDFSDRIEPALSASWRERSFSPCRSLCKQLGESAGTFQSRYHLAADDLLIPRIAEGSAFDRHVWRLLVGEILLVGAIEVPQFETAPDTFRMLLTGEAERPALPRGRLSPIDQAHSGSHDLVFATAIYRPEHVGLNGSDDVVRIADFLAAVDPAAWRPEDIHGLPGLPDQSDREEELAFAQEWFPALTGLYRRAAEQGHIVVTEVL